MWELVKKNPRFEIARDVHDKFVVPLHNYNRKIMNASEEAKIVMLMNMLQDNTTNKLNRSRVDLGYNGDFEDWYENQDLLIYRGVPESDFLEDELNNTVGKSYSLNKETALKFTNPAWVERVFNPSKEDRNGHIIVAKIKPKDIAIFNGDGFENEVVPNINPEIVDIIKIESGEEI
jgi:hypothetical protein